MENRFVGLSSTVNACFLIAVCSACAGGCLSSSSSNEEGTGGQGSGGAVVDRGGDVSGTAGASTAMGGIGGAVADTGGASGAGTGAVLAVAGDSATGGTYPIPDDVNQSGFLTWTFDGNPVGLYLPPPTDAPPPIVMFLHGCRNDPVDPNWWIINRLQEVEPCAVLLPFIPEQESPSCAAWGGTYDDNLRPAMVDALAGLDAVLEHYGLDGERQYLYGESMGAEGTLALLMHFPARFAGAIAVAGYSLDKGAEQIAQTPLWLIHGTADSINPFDSIEILHQSILNVGGSLVTLTEYPDTDHTPAIVRARSEPGLLDWLLAQRHDGILREVPGAGEGPVGGTLTFDVTGIDAAHEGDSIGIKLLSGAADCTSDTDSPSYTGEGKVAAGVCEVSIPLVAEGEYTACSFLDADGNAQPSPGDLVGQLSLWFSGDTTETWSATDWMQI